jgi:hypothetical protein
MICEKCNKRRATFIAANPNKHLNQWKILCFECNPENHYWITLHDIISLNKQIAWMGHLSEKRWFNAREFVGVCEKARRNDGQI